MRLILRNWDGMDLLRYDVRGVLSLRIHLHYQEGCVEMGRLSRVGINSCSNSWHYRWELTLRNS
jgi:hypothetical protein